jgi:hypothetical protein
VAPVLTDSGSHCSSSCPRWWKAHEAGLIQPSRAGGTGGAPRPSERSKRARAHEAALSSVASAKAGRYRRGLPAPNASGIAATSSSIVQRSHGDSPSRSGEAIT